MSELPGINPLGLELVLKRVLADTPALPGALCTKDPELWRGETEDDADLAAWSCENSCPAFEACAYWLESGDAMPVSGVVAGRRLRLTQAEPQRSAS